LTPGLDITNNNCYFHSTISKSILPKCLGSGPSSPW